MFGMTLPARTPAQYVSYALHSAKVPQVERSQALTLQYDKVVFILEPSEQAKAAIGKGVTVVDDPPWPLSFRYKAVELAYRTFDNVR